MKKIEKILIGTRRIRIEENEKAFRPMEDEEHKIFIKLLEDLWVEISGEKFDVKIGENNLQDFDKLYIRSIDTTRSIAPFLAKAADFLGVKVVEGKRYFYSSKGKLSQMMDAFQSQILIPKTYFFDFKNHPEKLDAIFEKNEKMIFKKINGSRGGGVFLVKNKEDVLKLLDPSADLDAYILQEFIPNDFDYRVFVCGEKIVSMSKRVRGCKKDFRNNLYLGAEEIFVKPEILPQDLAKNIVNCVKNSQNEVVGFDFIEHEGKWYCIEINPVPGLTANSSETEGLKEFLFNF